MRGTVGTATALLALGLVLTTRATACATARLAEVAFDAMHTVGIGVADATITAPFVMVAEDGTAVLFALWPWNSALTNSFAAAQRTVVRRIATVGARHDEIR